MVENLNFQPHEFGYVEPEIKPPAPVEETKEEPPKEDTRPLSKGNPKPGDKKGDKKNEDSKPVLSETGKEEEKEEI